MLLTLKIRKGNARGNYFMSISSTEVEGWMTEAPWKFIDRQAEK